MFAAEEGNVPAVSVLLSKSADPNAKSNVISCFQYLLYAYITFFPVELQNGNTALMFAAKRGKIAVVELLLNSGADVKARNNVSSSFFIFVQQLNIIIEWRFCAYFFRN